MGFRVPGLCSGGRRGGRALFQMGAGRSAQAKRFGVPVVVPRLRGARPWPNETLIGPAVRVFLGLKVMRLHKIPWLEATQILIWGTIRH